MNNLNELTALARDLRDQIEVERLTHIQPLQAQLDELEAQIGAMICDLGQTVRTDAATLTYVSASVRTSWDNKKLEQYAEAHPEIGDFKRQTEIAAQVRIKYNPPK
jgi:hypothetical protein